MAVSANVVHIGEGTSVHIGGARFRVERVIDDAAPFALVVARRADLPVQEASRRQPDDPFLHVDDDVHPCLWGSADERRARFRTMFDGECPWAGRAEQEEALGALHQMVDSTTDPTNKRLVITGPTGAGKRSVIRRFRAERAAIGEPSIGSDPSVVVVSTWTSTQGFYEACAAAMGAAGARALAAIRLPSVRNADRRRHVVDAMRSAGVRLLVIEQLHHHVDRTPAYVRRRIETLDALAAELDIGLACLSDTAPSFGGAWPSLWRAARHITIERCAPGSAFSAVVSRVECRLPLREPSRLDRPAMAGRLYAATDGDVNRLWILLSELVDEALAAGQEFIDHDLVDQLARAAKDRDPDVLERDAR